MSELTVVKPNAEKLRQVLTFIRNNREKWKQNNWVCETPECGTAACFAGWTCLLNGWELVEGTNYVRRPGANVTRGGQPIKYAAQHELGLNDRQQNLLFNGGNTLGRLTYYVNRIIEGEL